MTERSLLVVLPALNEAATIASVIQQIPEKIDGIDRIAVVVVDDGSSDTTAELATRAGAKVIRHARNLGVGRAIQTGLREARRLGFDYAVNIDADGQFSPADIPELLKPVLSGDADMATASRFMDPALVPDMPVAKRIGNRIVSRIISVLTGRTFFDVSCGFRACNKRAIRRLILRSNFTYTHEAILVLCFANLNIVEVPLKVRGVREYGHSRVARNVLRYGWQASRIIFSTLRDFHPSLFFFSLASLFIVPGILFGVFFLVHRMVAGAFSPHIWAGFVGAYLIAIGALIVLLGLVAGMLNRHRLLLEEQLYVSQRSLDLLEDRNFD